MRLRAAWTDTYIARHAASPGERGFFARARKAVSMLAMIAVLGASLVAAETALDIASDDGDEASAILVGTVDTGGPDDWTNPNRNDLSLMQSDSDSSDGSIDVVWQLDDASIGGGEESQGCALYDTDGDGNVNYALCVSLIDDGGSTLSEPVFYECDDSKNNKCQQPDGGTPLPDDSCTLSLDAPDPFAGDQDHQNAGPQVAPNPDVDARVECEIPVSMFDAEPSLLNVCTYPAGPPNSDDKDCVVPPGFGFVRIEKYIEGGTPDGTFNFELDGALVDPPVTTDGGTGSTENIGVVEGAHTVEELVPGGWTLLSGSCADDTDVDDPTTAEREIDVSPGETVVCAFTNELDTGTLTIAKNVTPPGSQTETFSFTETYSVGGGSFGLTHGESEGPVTVEPGTYTVTETVPANWALVDVTCDDGDPATVNDGNPSVNLMTGELVVTVESGQDLTCTFTNTQRAGVSVTKTVEGSPPASEPTEFTVTVTCDGFDPVEVQVSDGETVSPVELAAVPVGTTCSAVEDTSGLSTTWMVTQPGDQDVDDDGITFEVTNLWPSGGVSVAKTVIGDGPVPVDGFEITVTCDGFDPVTVKLFDGETVSPVELADVPVGTSCSTSETDPGDQWTVTEDTLEVGTGDNVLTVINEAKRAGLTIRKITEGDVGSFFFTGLGTFTLTTTAEGPGGADSHGPVEVLVPGDYTVTETVPAGWTLTSADCDGAESTLDGSALSITMPDDPDVAVVCTFTNTKNTAGLTIVKKTIGGDGTFSFSSVVAPGGGFDLTTVGNTASSDSFPVDVPGTYTVSETVPAGWTLTGAECEGADGTLTGSDLSIVIGDTSDPVVCTFTNTRNTAGLTIVKETVGGDGTFSFTGPGGEDVSLTTGTGDPADAQETFTVDIPGEYTVSEDVPDGWTLTGIECVGAAEYDGDLNNGSVVIDIADPTDPVTCTFTNTKDKKDTKVTIIKKTKGGEDGKFQFRGDFGRFTLMTEDGYAERSFEVQAPGDYMVRERAQDGWVLTDIYCTGDDFEYRTRLERNKLKLRLGEEANGVVCIFTNVPDKKDTTDITIIKKTKGGEDGEFDFEGDLGKFELDTSDGYAEKRFDVAVPDTYTVTELDQEGWVLTSVYCTGADDWEQNGNSVDITVDEDNTGVVCIFTNVPDKKDTTDITIVKQTKGDEDGTFHFEGDLGKFDLTTVDAFAEETLVVNVGGTYTVTEVVPDGWILSSVYCVGDEGEVQDGSSVDVTVGEASVICYFTNVPDKKDTTDITIVKQTKGDEDGTFHFEGDLGKFDLTTVDAFAEETLVVNVGGTYTVTEVVPDGWILSSVYCVGDEGEVQDGSSVDVTVGEASVICYFTNVPDKKPPETTDLTIVKQANGGDDTFYFDGDLGPFELTTSGGFAEETFEVEVPDTYTVTELVEPGWEFKQYHCTGADGVVREGNSLHITIEEGNTGVTCLFKNEPKDVPPPVVCGEGSIDFGDLPLLNQNNERQYSDFFGHIAPGVYNISLVSSDPGHAAGHQPEQTAESWRLQYRDESTGNWVDLTPNTPDLPIDLVTQTYVDIATGVTIPAGVIALRAQHARSGTNINSVIADCAILEMKAPPPPVEPPPEPPAPECAADAIGFDGFVFMNRDGRRVNTYARNIAPGEYAASSITEDLGHAPGHQTLQTEEQVRFVFLDADGAVVAVSGYTDDVPTEVTSTYSDLGVIDLMRPVTHIRVEHINVGQINSVTVKCLNLNLIKAAEGTTPPVEAPENPAPEEIVAKEEESTPPKEDDEQPVEEAEDEQPPPDEPPEEKAEASGPEASETAPAVEEAPVEEEAPAEETVEEAPAEEEETPEAEAPTEEAEASPEAEEAATPEA